MKNTIKDPRYPKLVLIGPDCGGKSTLVSGLREHYQIAPRSNRKVHNAIEMLHGVLQFAKDVIPHYGFILDQWQYPVDIVYEHCMHQRLSPVANIDTELASWCRKHHVLFIHITADDATLTERFNHRGDELWSLEQILAVARCYRRYLRNTATFPYITIDTSGRTPEEVLEEAINRIDTYYKDVIKKERM